MITISLHHDSKAFLNKTLKNDSDKKIIIVTEDITAINRKRLIDQKISFIIPGKQMFLAELLIDIQDFNRDKALQKEFLLLPSAQLILLYQILHKEDDLGQYTF